MDSMQHLAQLSLQLDLLKGTSELAPLNQTQLERLSALEDRLLSLMERSVEGLISPPAPLEKAPPPAPRIPDIRPPIPRSAKAGKAAKAPPPAEAPTPGAIAFKTTGPQHLSEIVQRLLSPVLDRALSFDELSAGVKRILTDTPGLSSQRPPPGTTIQIAGLLQDFGVTPEQLDLGDGPQGAPLG